MILLDWISKKGKEKKRQQEVFQRSVKDMFPTLEYAHTAERMREMLPQGDLNPSQYKWLGKSHPYQLSPLQWTDMMATQEGLTEPQVSQLHSDYYKGGRFTVHIIQIIDGNASLWGELLKG